MTLLRHASPRSSRLWIYFLILLTFPIGDRSSRIVEGGRGYAPRGYAPRSSRLRTLPPPPPPRRTCSLGVENPDTGLVMSDGDGDSSKWVASLSASNAVTCARHCCRHESCSLAWFISDQDIDYAEENENCFLVNCEDPHVCRLKRSDLRDSVTHVYRKRGIPGEEYPSTTRASTRKLKKLTKKPTTTTTTMTTMAKKKKTTTTRSKIDPFMKAVENNNLEAHELKLLLDTLGTLSSEEQLKIDQLIDKVLDKYGTNATTAEATTTTPTTTTPTTTTTTTTTPTTTTTTTKTAATTTTERTKSPTSSASTKTTATGKKTADSQTAEAELTKKKTKSPEETTVKKATTTTTAAATAKETTTKKSKRPDWMQPRDSAVVDAGTDASAGVQATVDVELIQLKPPRVHMGLLTAACVIGVVATIVVVFSMQRRVLNAWRKKDYIDADYLINGMYQPNI